MRIQRLCRHGPGRQSRYMRMLFWPCQAAPRRCMCSCQDWNLLHPLGTIVVRHRLQVRCADHRQSGNAHSNAWAAMGESSPTFRCRTRFRRRASNSSERVCVLQSLPATVPAVSKARRRHRSRTATSRGRGSPMAILPVSIRIPGSKSLQTALVGNGLCRYTV